MTGPSGSPTLRILSPGLRVWWSLVPPGRTRSLGTDCTSLRRAPGARDALPSPDSSLRTAGVSVVPRVALLQRGCGNGRFPVRSRSWSLRRPRLWARPLSPSFASLPTLHSSLQVRHAGRECGCPACERAEKRAAERAPAAGRRRPQAPLRRRRAGHAARRRPSRGVLAASSDALRCPVPRGEPIRVAATTTRPSSHDTEPPTPPPRIASV